MHKILIKTDGRASGTYLFMDGKLLEAVLEFRIVHSPKTKTPHLEVIFIPESITIENTEPNRRIQPKSPIIPTAEPPKSEEAA